MSYYESAALGWERAAFVRARACAGDLALGHRFLQGIEPFVWRRALDFGAFEEIRAIGQKVRDHYASRQTFGPGYDLKRGRGGIREAEFFAQARQLVHGGRDRRLRAPATLDAIGALAAAGHLDPEFAGGLAEAYRRLRTIEHRAQMIDDQQTHLLPAEPERLAAVARLHGFASADELLDWLEPGVALVGEAFDELAGTERKRLPSDPEALRGELAGLGLVDPEPAVRRIAEWRSGRARSLRSPAALDAFESMLPAMLGAIAASADPDHALNRLSDVVERVPSGVNLYRLLEARPGLATLLARLLAHAPALADQLARRPALIDTLLDASCFEPASPPAKFAQFLTGEMRGKPYDLAIDRARRIVNERRFALGVQLVDQRDDPLWVGRGYASVAEGALVALASAAVAEFEGSHGRFTGAELVILGLGRLGGGVLTHASDLDLIYLFTTPDSEASDGERPLGPADYFNRLANRVTAALSVATAAGPLYDVDTRLRPQGAQGMLAVSLDAFAQYQRSEAWTFEHMALARARPVFGSPAARTSAAALIEGILRQSRERSAIVADAAKMRGEIARHKPEAGPLDVKLGPGGLVDLEFAVHALQLTTGVGLDPSLEQAVEQLATAELIRANIIDAQKLLTRMLVVNRLLAPQTAMPNHASRELMAKLCGAPNWEVLLGRHDEARQEIAKLWTTIKESA
jgi:glutamate-ammonia-ligase adenylyltransferase